MAIETLFSGNALRDVDHDGRTVLPGFVLRVLEGRRAGPVLLFGRHEADPCISGYDEGHQTVLQAEIERRRLRDEAQGLDPGAHHSRARRAFGTVERVAYDANGRVTLPPMTRRRGRIGERALFIGAGGNFEVWNPELAREAADGEVRELAEFALSQPPGNEESEEES
jgi:MraZ protein